MFRLMVQPVRRRTLYMTGTESNDGSVATDDWHGCEVDGQQRDGARDEVCP